MYPNKMSRAFGRKTAPSHQRSATILHSEYEVLFCMAIFLSTPNPGLMFVAKKLYLVSSEDVGWCDTNHLQLNIRKTKELVVDYRRSKKRAPTPITIREQEVEAVDNYKFLGVHINNKLDWTDNTEALYRKGQSNLYFRRRL